jgi:hypothetical protein
VLTKFVEDRADTFLAATRLTSRLESADRATAAEEVVQRANVFSSTYQTKDVEGKKWRYTYKTCPLVWDTGASAGLTPFWCDFIDSMKCQILVNDIARTNMVTGIGTTLHKFWMNGEAIYLPCLSYHLPSGEVRLFSPQTYHKKLYGGHSSVFGDRVVKMVDNLSIEVDRMINESACTFEEIKEIGPYMKSALQQYERKTDFLGSWSACDFSTGGVSSAMTNKNDVSFGLKMFCSMRIEI